MRCGSVSIGIVDYVAARYRESDLKLRYAVSDAVAFHRYVSAAWNGTNAEIYHRLITNRNAVQGVVETEVGQLANNGPFDLFFLYLTGHGEVGAGSTGWFCLADATPGSPSLDGPRLDRLLLSLNAKRIIAFIDCCHAEAITSSMNFFSSLDERQARLFIVSARKDQRAWEEDSLERSIFSDVLLRALSSDSQIADVSGQVSIETLFPYIRTHVALYSLSKKRGIPQEPVTGGVCAESLKLPTVASRSLGRPLTVTETVRARLKRIVGAGFILILLTVVAADLLLFHLAVRATGEIVVRPGISALFELNPLHLVRETDTGLTLAMLDRRNEPLFRRLRDGSLWGFTTHLEERGLRAWLSELEPALRKQSRSSIRALAGGKKSTFELDNEAAPIEEGVFLARLHGLSITLLAQEMYPLRRTIDLSCNDDFRLKIDFTLLSASAEVFARDLAWLAATAPPESAERAAQVLQFVKIAAYRALHEKDADIRGREFDAFAAALFLLIDQSSARDTVSALASKELQQVSAGQCRLFAAFALAVLSRSDEGNSAERELAKTLSSYDRSRQGDLPSAEQATAAKALAFIAQRRPLDSSSFSALEAMMQRDQADLATATLAHTLLADIAPFQALPAAILTQLLAKLGAPQKQFDFDPLAAARILARNARFLGDQARQALRAWIAANAREIQSMTIFHEALGFLSLAGVPVGEYSSLLVQQISPATYFAPSAVTYRGEMLITANGDAATVALGRIAQSAPQPSETLERLAHFAMSRQDAVGREEIIRGLARQQAISPERLPSEIHDALARAKTDSARRRLEIEVAIERLAIVPRSARERAIDELLNRWRLETEPELRIALARVTAGALLR